MFPQRQHYFTRLTKSYPLMSIIDVYDKDSFIREYILDNVFVCIFMYILFYFAVWYAHKVIKRIDRKNQEMLLTVDRNRSKINDLMALKNKRAEYEEIVIKAKGAQKITTIQLDNEIKRLSTELLSTMGKLEELEKFLSKWMYWKNCTEQQSKKKLSGEIDSSEGNGIDDIKILVPSFPPSEPPEPPPRKFGVFARPPAPCSPPPKIGFK